MAESFCHMLSLYYQVGQSIVHSLSNLPRRHFHWQRPSFSVCYRYVLKLLMILLSYILHLFYRKYYLIRGWLSDGSLMTLAVSRSPTPSASSWPWTHVATATASTRRTRPAGSSGKVSEFSLSRIIVSITIFSQQRPAGSLKTSSRQAESFTFERSKFHHWKSKFSNLLIDSFVESYGVCS